MTVPRENDPEARWSWRVADRGADGLPQAYEIEVRAERAVMVIRLWRGPTGGWHAGCDGLLPPTALRCFDATDAKECALQCVEDALWERMAAIRRVVERRWKRRAVTEEEPK